MKTNILLLVILISSVIASCNKPKKNYECTDHPQLIYSNHYEGLQAIPADVHQRLYESKGPLSDGSLGRNQSGYFSVRFQMDMGFVANYAVANQDITALDQYIKTVEYSFSHQLPNGNFELIVPADLSELPTATEADSASGVAFFMSALGNSLLTVDESPWFQGLSDTSYQHRLNNLNAQIQLSLDWLESKQAVLASADEFAPNRLLFDALAYYCLGSYLGDMQAQNLGITFAQSAIAQQDQKGYYYELGGWDSSYQGVGLLNGFQLIMAINNNHGFHSELWSSVSCGTDWQKSRVLKKGEISLKDNTRVYEGGEEFLGQEKGIAWIDSYLAFLYMNHLSGRSDFGETASDVRSYYE